MPLAAIWVPMDNDSPTAASASEPNVVKVCWSMTSGHARRVKALLTRSQICTSSQSRRRSHCAGARATAHAGRDRARRSLPELGGAEVATRLLAADPALRILALSAHTEAAFARLMLDAGAVGYAVKRSACDELVRAVRVVGAGGRYVDPTIGGVLLGASRSRSPSGISSVSLSAREAEVVRLVAQGHTAKKWPTR